MTPISSGSIPAAIHAAAGTLFAERGYKGVSVQEIAKAGCFTASA
jgi:AcrR family transcriptional regulator